MSDSPELLKPDTGVTDSELRIELPNSISELQNENQQLRTELGNSEAENEKLRTDYAALLESSTVVTNKLREEVRELRSQLEAEKRNWEELDDTEETCTELRGELADREEKLAAALSEVSDLKQKSAAASKDLPEAADLLNQLRTRRKKFSASLADVELILEMIEESCI